jgi:N-acyl-D-aspartate/D-glutamate deacylase
MAEHDLVIRGGTVVDGTGAPEKTADVAVDGDRITAVGRVSGAGRREISASGALVAPGWVDIHAHYDGQATWDDQMAPSSWHGVTTVVMGNCGVGFAPVHDHDRDRLIELMEGVEDIPGAALHEGLSWEWHTFADYLDVLDARPRDIDVGAQVPHGAVRLHVMGERGAAREPATPTEIAEMAEIVRAGVEAGGLGFTTSRTLNHRSSRGEPTPTLTAAAEELAGIAAALGAAGKGVLQVVSDFKDLDDEFATMRRMVAESGRHLSISVAQSPVVPDQYRVLLDRITEANADGLPMTAQVATRAIGLLFGLQCTLNPFMTAPAYKEIRERPLAERVAIMRDPAFRRRVLDEIGDTQRGVIGGRLIHKFHLMYLLGDPPDYEPEPSTCATAIAEREGRTAAEVVYDWVLEDEGRAFVYMPSLNYVDGDLRSVREMLLHPHTVPGLGDGGAHVGTISDGSFPTTLLAHWGRDRTRGERLEVPFIVKSHAADTARRVGLLDRGVLAPGYKADVNVIDFERLRVRAPVMTPDLPAGGNRLLQRAEGYVHTICSGVETYRDGEATGALPGRLVRGAQPAPSTAVG